MSNKNISQQQSKKDKAARAVTQTDLEQPRLTGSVDPVRPQTGAPVVAGAPADFIKEVWFFKDKDTRERGVVTRILDEQTQSANVIAGGREYLNVRYSGTGLPQQGGWLDLVGSYRDIDLEGEARVAKVETARTDLDEERAEEDRVIVERRAEEDRKLQEATDGISQ